MEFERLSKCPDRAIIRFEGDERSILNDALLKALFKAAYSETSLTQEQKLVCILANHLLQDKNRNLHLSNLNVEYIKALEQVLYDYHDEDISDEKAMQIEDLAAELGTLAHDFDSETSTANEVSSIDMQFRAIISQIGPLHDNVD